MQRLSCNSVEQLGQKRDAATQSELTVAVVNSELPEAIGSKAARFILVETYHREPGPAIAIPDSSRNFRVFAEFDFMAGDGHAAAPGITYDAPSAQPTPSAQEFPDVADSSVARVKRNRVTAHFDGHVS